MPTPEELDDIMADNYNAFLLKQSDHHLIGQLESLTCVDPLEEDEIKQIIHMIKERDYTGKGNVSFEDLRKGS